MQKFRYNTDDIKRAVEGVTTKDLPTEVMVRGQSVTVYPEVHGFVRVLAHRETGVVSWIGYWFPRESTQEQLEAMVRESDTYAAVKLKSAGTHFYYSQVNDAIDFKLGVETLNIGIGSSTFGEPFDDFGGESLPVPSFKPAKREQLKLTRQQVLWSRLSDGAKEIYRKEVKKLWDAVNVPARWEQKSRGLYLDYTHRMDRISDADQPIYIELLRAEFKDSCDHVCIYSKHIVLEVSFNGGN